ncbi:MAG: tetratricopeptide repeat protein [Xenococcaceae cyanobacterium]
MDIGRTLLSRYKIINELGSGGFGDTYLAQDIALPGNPTCVVKHLKPKDPNPDILPIAKKLFEREAEFLCRLGENNQIPRLYAHFCEGGEFYLVEEFVDGDDLSKEIIPGKQLSEEQTVKLLQEILEVLAVVHQQNVIHRDIKPQNIIRRKRDGKLVLIDFGAVKEISVLTVDSQGQTSLTVGIGSTGYTPYEQFNGYPKLSSDIYAVGMIGIQALTGLPPNQLQKDPNTMEVIWRNRVQVSDRLGSVLDTMVRYNFSQRYQNASEALQGFIPIVVSSTPSPLPHTVTADRVWSTEQLYPSPSTPQQAKLSPWKVIVGLVVAAIAGIAVINRSSFLPSSPVTSSPTPTPEPSASKSIPPKSNSAFELVKKGDELYSSQRYEEALAAYEEALKINQDYPEAWNGLGWSLREFQRYEEALAAFDKALEINPYSVYSWNGRGNVLYYMRRYQESLTAYNKSIEMSSDYANSWNGRGWVLGQLQQYEEALAAFDQALSLDSNDANSWNGRGWILYKMQRYEEAIASYDKALEIQPDFQQAITNRKLAQNKLNQ